MKGMVPFIKQKGVNAMTNEEYSKFLKHLEHDVFNSCPIIGLANAKAVVSKAVMEKHSYGE